MRAVAHDEQHRAPASASSRRTRTVVAGSVGDRSACSTATAGAAARGRVPPRGVPQLVPQHGQLLAQLRPAGVVEGGALQVEDEADAADAGRDPGAGQQRGAGPGWVRAASWPGAAASRGLTARCGACSRSAMFRTTYSAWRARSSSSAMKSNSVSQASSSPLSQRVTVRWRPCGRAVRAASADTTRWPGTACGPVTYRSAKWRKYLATVAAGIM